MDKKFEFGFYTFGDIVPAPVTGAKTPQHQRVKDIVEAAKLADDAGFDLIGIGEHHTADFVLSAPVVLLSAISQVTKNIKLSTAVAVLSTQDPVRLFEEFSTLDLLSNGRSEILVGRGSTTESFPLFGFDLNDYDALFSEKLDLLNMLNNNAIVNWKGKFRSPLIDAEIQPRPLKPIPIWIGVGGSPDSAARAGKAGAHMNLAILGGPPERFKHLVDIYRASAAEAGHDVNALKIAVSSHSYVGETSKQAREEMYGAFSHSMAYLMKKLRGVNYHIGRGDFEAMTAPDTALTIGSPQEMIDKIMRQYELFDHDRYVLQMDMNGLPFDKLARSIELVATKVAPEVKKLIDKK